MTPGQTLLQAAREYAAFRGRVLDESPYSYVQIPVLGIANGFEFISIPVVTLGEEHDT